MIFEFNQKGKIKPVDMILPECPEYKEKQKLLSQAMIQLKDSMGKEYDKVEELVNMMSNLQSMEDTEHFHCGFAIGVLLMLEVFRYAGNVGIGARV